MHAITSGLGQGSIRLTDPSRVKRILVCRPNGRLGNMLLLTPVVRELQESFPDARIDLFVKGNHARSVFSNFNQVDRIIALPEKPFRQLASYLHGWIRVRMRQYDLVFNADPGSSSGRLSAKFALGRTKLFGQLNLAQSYPDAAHMAKNPVLRVRDYLALAHLSPRQARLPELTLFLDPEEIAHGKGKLREIVPHRFPVVCLFTYATGPKDFGPQWWQNLLTVLKKEFPTVNFMEMLPAHGASALNYKLPSIYSRNIREMGAVLANCAAFIGADSGVMHLASASGTSTIGLFKMSRKEKYAPYNRQSVGLDMNLHGNDDIMRHLARIIGPKVTLTGLTLARELAN